MFCNDEHHQKALYSIVVTLFGILILFNALQPLKAYSSIVITLFGMSMLCSAEQLPYLQPVITQYSANNKSEIWA